MHRIVERDELMFGRRGPGAKLVSGIAMRLFGLRRANRIYDRTFDRAECYTGRLLEYLDISYHIDPSDLENIPRSGALVVISNHPTGAMDGVVLIDVLSKIRPDIKFLGNFLLERVEPLKPYVISVDPFDNVSPQRNVSGLKQAFEHLRNGGLLALFPAGEVSTWQKGFSDVKDKLWSPSVLRFIRRAGVPVLPLCIRMRNSFLFHLVGKIHPMMRTAMLPHELFNKRGKCVEIVVGSPVSPKRLESLDDTAYGDYLRASVDYLFDCRETLRDRSRCGRSGRSEEPCRIADRKEVAALRLEMDSLRDEFLLFDHGVNSVFCAPPDRMPCMMHEIGRMREITFRHVGEGTHQAIDTDTYDTYYRQLFVWDNETDSLVGAYRMGFGDEIVPKYGLKGFYTYSLFDYDPRMEPILEKTIELGRSFIVDAYQRKPISLMLLWKGIVYVLLKYGQFRNLLGPVTISGEYQRSSKTIIAAYLQRHHYNSKLGPMVTPRTGLDGVDAPLDLSLLDRVDSFDLVGRIVSDIEQGRRSIPVLMKKYLQVNSTVLGFNVDHEFCDCLDALMLLDLKHVPEATIQMLSKEMEGIDVVARFKAYGE